MAADYVRHSKIVRQIITMSVSAVENVRQIINMSVGTHIFGGRCSTNYKYVHGHKYFWWKMFDKL